MHRFHDVLKPQTVGHCLLYVGQFCPSPVVSDFFLRSFVFSVADPELAVETFYFMNSIKCSPWMEFAAGAGNVERFFDLFSSHLTIPKSESPVHQIDLRVCLAHLLTDLVLTNARLVLRVNMVSALLISVLTLVEVVPDQYSPDFLRCAIRIFNFCFATGSEYAELFNTFTDRIVKLTVSGGLFQSYLHQWLSTHLQAITASYFFSLIANPCSLPSFDLHSI
jgi:hypothetical protein